MRKKVLAQISALTANFSLLAFAAPAYAQGWTIPTVIPDLPDPCTLANNIATFMVGVAVAVAVIFLVLGGIQYMQSGGDKMAVEQARGKITGAVVGGLIAIAAYAVLTFIIQTILRGTIPQCTTPFPA